MRQRGKPKVWLAPRLVCYSFESCCHSRRFISLHRWPYLPLYGGHVAFEQFNARWPLPHVAGSPDLGVLSASLTAVGPSDRSRRFGLADPTSSRLSPTALPCSHATFGQHAGGTNHGSIPRRSPWHVAKFCLPPSGIRSATSTTIDFGANCPFTFVPAYCLPVYASQSPLPDTTQDSVRGCRLSFAAVAISGDMVSCAFKAQPAQNRTSAGGKLCGRPPRVKGVFGLGLSRRLQVCVRPVRAAMPPALMDCPPPEAPIWISRLMRIPSQRVCLGSRSD